MYKAVMGVTLMVLSVSTYAQTVTVGWDDACDYDVRTDSDAINTAITDGNSEIRVSNENDYLSGVLIEDSLILKGGYGNCTDAAADIPSLTKTRMDATTVLPTALKVFPDGETVDVSVSGFLIENATGAGGDGSWHNVAAGAAIVEAGGVVNLSNIVINNNHSEFESGGFAVRLDVGVTHASQVVVNMHDVIITNNSGGFHGGGMACLRGSSTVTVNITGNSGISYNHSDYFGGGLYMLGCTIHFTSGTNTPSPSDPRGIHANTADISGGGVAISDEGMLVLKGSQSDPFNITSNRANLDEVNGGDGGGIFLSGEFVDLIADRIRIADNETDSEGGGIALQGKAQALINNNFRGCSWNPLCGEISNNRAKNGGGVHLRMESFLTLVGIEGTGNRANSGSLLAVRDNGSNIQIESALFHHNGNSDHTDYLDNFLIANQLGDSSIGIGFSTIVDNDVRFATIYGHNGTEGYLSVFRTIIDDPGIPPVSFVLPEVTLSVVSCSIFSDTSTLNNIIGNQVYEEIPVFVDRPNQDYHLTAPPNTALDQCQVSGGSPVSLDVDGETRGFDLVDVANIDGAFDIGYDEYIPEDTEHVFTNGFE